MAKISVIVPIYKVERYIERCVCSLMEQTMEDIEYIFVDDASPDSSIAILKDCIKRYPRREPQIKIIVHEFNKGLPAARNSGLNVARGEYLFHCDSDDYVERDMLEIMYRTAVHGDCDLVYCDYYLSYANSERRISNKDYSDAQAFFQEGLLGGIVKYNVWNKLVKRTLYLDNGITFPDGHGMGEDMTMICLASCCKSVRCVDRALYHYNKVNSNAFSFSFTEKHLNDIKFNVERTISYINSKRENPDDSYLAFFKLNTKLPFLFSDKFGDYRTWSSLWPESDRYIMKNTAQPLRTRLIQWVASKHLYTLIWIYFSVVYKLIYRKLYN